MASISGNHDALLVRVDWNVPISEGKVLDDSRIVETIPTLRQLLQHTKRLVVLTHLGRPKGKIDPEYSLTKLLPCIKKLLPFVNIRCAADLEDIKSSDEGVILLENIRFWSGEEENSKEFAKTLASLGSAYVNDAFSVSHRAHASVDAITDFLPSYAGLLLEKELKDLREFSQLPQIPVVMIVGGAKVSTKLGLIQNFLDKVDTIVPVGGIANTFLKAKGYEVGTSLIEPDLIESAAKIMADSEKLRASVLLPEDVRVGKSLKDTSTVKSVTDIGVDEAIYDIGPKGFEAIKQVCENSKTIIWNGALGVFEQPGWDEGTLNLARVLAELTRNKGVKTLAGGGETVLALNIANVLKDITYVSFSGGAFLEFMEGKKLPGIEALERNG